VAKAQARGSSGLGRYLKEIGKKSLLNREEEVALSTRSLKGDARARNELIQRNLRLAVSVAKKMQRKGVDLEDLIQEANIGLMKAVEKFDPSKGFRFSTYAHWWIRQAVGRHIQMHCRSIRIPSHAQGLSVKINAAKKEYAEEFGCEPSGEELAEILGVTQNALDSAMNAPAFTVSLDKPKFRDGESGTIGSMIEDVWSETASEKITKTEIKSVILKSLKKLSKREQSVIRLRFGISDPEPGENYTISVQDHGYLGA